jgi:hypothetical protein
VTRSENRLHRSGHLQLRSQVSIDDREVAVTNSDDPRDGYLAPWTDWQARSDGELVDRLQGETAGVEPETPEARAAIALVIGVGNYEALLGDERSDVIIDAAVERLKALGYDDRSKYWG